MARPGDVCYSEVATLRDAVSLTPRASKPKPKLVIRQKKPMTKLEYKKAMTNVSSHGHVPSARPISMETTDQ